MTKDAMNLALKALQKIHEGCGFVQEENLHKDAKDLATLVRKDCNLAIKDLTQAIAEADEQVLVGHADLAINNIYVFNDQEERVVPEGRQGIYLCLQTPKHD